MSRSRSAGAFGRRSPLSVALAVSIALHATAAGWSIGRGAVDRAPVVEPERAIPLRLTLPLRAAVESGRPPAVPAQAVRPEQAQEHEHAHAHRHPHPHPRPESKAAATARPQPSTPVNAEEPRPLPPRTSPLARAAATPVRHGDAPSIASAPAPDVAVPAPAAAPPAPVAVPPALVAAPPAPAAVTDTPSDERGSAVISAAGATRATPPADPSRADASVSSPQTLTRADPGAGNAARFEPPHYNLAYLNNPRPVYPAAARRLGLEGVVLVRVLVGAGGRVEDIKVQTSSGTELLDEAALHAVRGWTFVPARRGEQTVSHWAEIPIRFRIAE